MGVGSYWNAPVLFNVATMAYERVRDAPDARVRNEGAITAVVFSAVALEAFINELPEFAMAVPVAKPPVVEAFAALAGEVERSHGSIELKFLLASALLAGRAYDRGTQPYQDFKLLVDLRNELVHYKPRDKVQLRSGDDAGSAFAVVPRNLVRRLASRKLIDAAMVERASFLGLLGTPVVAAWACNAAVAMVRSVVAMLPDSPLKEVVQFQANSFQPVHEGSRNVEL